MLIKHPQFLSNSISRLHLHPHPTTPSSYLCIFVLKPHPLCESHLVHASLSVSICVVVLRITSRVCAINEAFLVVAGMEYHYLIVSGISIKLPNTTITMNQCLIQGFHLSSSYCAVGLHICSLYIPLPFHTPHFDTHQYI